MGKKSSSYLKPENWFKSPSSLKKEGRQEAEEEARAREATTQAELDKIKAATAEAEAQQEAVRKKMASLGRLQAGYTFSDSQAGTGATKVFS